jgi:hypothetical protein
MLAVEGCLFTEASKPFFYISFHICVSTTSATMTIQHLRQTAVHNPLCTTTVTTTTAAAAAAAPITTSTIAT